MSIELSKEDRAQAVASIERYFRENMEEKIGNVERLQARVAELDFEVHEGEFAYWQRYDKKRKVKP